MGHSGLALHIYARIRAGKRSKIPSTELDLLRRHLTPQEKAAKAHPKLRYADGRVYVPSSWAGGRDGRCMPTSAEGRRRFPRINAFEVVANGQTIYSKLAGGPTAPFPRVVDGAYVDIAARLAKVFARLQLNPDPQTLPLTLPLPLPLPPLLALTLILALALTRSSQGHRSLASTGCRERCRERSCSR